MEGLLPEATYDIDAMLGKAPPLPSDEELQNLLGMAADGSEAAQNLLKSYGYSEDAWAFEPVGPAPPSILAPGYPAQGAPFPMMTPMPAPASAPKAAPTGSMGIMDELQYGTPSSFWSSIKQASPVKLDFSNRSLPLRGGMATTNPQRNVSR